MKIKIISIHSHLHKLAIYIIIQFCKKFTYINRSSLVVFKYGLIKGFILKKKNILKKVFYDGFKKYSHFK